jgi:hypothetical protein
MGSFVTRPPNRRRPSAIVNQDIAGRRCEHRAAMHIARRQGFLAIVPGHDHAKVWLTGQICDRHQS